MASKPSIFFPVTQVWSSVTSEPPIWPQPVCGNQNKWKFQPVSNDWKHFRRGTWDNTVRKDSVQPRAPQTAGHTGDTRASMNTVLWSSFASFFSLQYEKEARITRVQLCNKNPCTKLYLSKHQYCSLHFVTPWFHPPDYVEAESPYSTTAPSSVFENKTTLKNTTPLPLLKFNRNYLCALMSKYL